VLTLWGDRGPYQDLVSGQLEASLGPSAAELFVLRGHREDLPRLQALLSRHPMNAARLSAIARFGDPTVWAFLAHHLADEALGEAAARALTTLFGPLVPADKRLQGAAWRGAIGARSFDPTVRYRRGRPWSPVVVADELESGDLNRVEMEQRIDELRVRAGIESTANVWAWFPDAQAGVSAVADEARKRGASVPAGGY
jgi:hypothetical protein